MKDKTVMTIRHHLSEQLLTGYAAGQLPEAFNLIVATQVSLCDECRARLAALEAGRAMGAELPTDIDVVGIVIERGDVFGEDLSDVVEAAVPVAAAAVEEALRGRRSR